jgi:hypothetical protein
MSRRTGNNRFRIALVVIATTLAGCASQRALRDFKTDGCSLFPDRSPVGHVDWPWCHCCVEHDLKYWRGGTAEDRRAADDALKKCVQHDSDSPALATAMFAGVRVGGGPYLPTPFRWGYGWPFLRPYGQLTHEEKLHADKLEKDYRDLHPVLMCRYEEHRAP